MTVNAEPNLLRRLTANWLVRVGLVGLVVITVVPSTWCFGVWGRSSLTAHGLFQCYCPAVSNTVRYRPMEVLYEACGPGGITDFSPDGSLWVLERVERDGSRQSGRVQVVSIVDHQTRRVLGEVRAVGAPVGFVSDHEIVFGGSASGSRLYNWQTDRLYEIQEKLLVEPEDILTALVGVTRTVRIGNWPFVIAFGPDYPNSDSGMFSFPLASPELVTLPHPELIDVMTTEHGYYVAPTPVRSSGLELPSHTGRWVATRAGIRRADGDQAEVLLNGQRATDSQGQLSPDFVFAAPMFWLPGDRGVVYQLTVNSGSLLARNTPMPQLIWYLPEEFWSDPE